VSGNEAVLVEFVQRHSCRYPLSPHIYSIIEREKERERERERERKRERGGGRERARSAKASWVSSFNTT
jgi:hypothetical protein